MEVLGVLFFLFLISGSATGLEACSVSNFGGFVGLLVILCFLAFAGML